MIIILKLPHFTALCLTSRKHFLQVRPSLAQGDGFLRFAIAFKMLSVAPF